MKTCLAVLLLVLTGGLLWAQKPVKHTFAPGQYKNWRAGGELLQVIQKEDAVLLQASEVSFARLILPLSLTPGRSYRIMVQGAGPMDVKIRRSGAGSVNDIALQNVFGRSPICEFIYTPPAEYKASVRLMLCPALRNTPVRLERFELTPLGEDISVAAGLPEKVIQPPTVRGFVFEDGVLTEERAKAVSALHGNFVRVRLRDAEDLARAKEVCRIARRNGLKITLEFMHGSGALNKSAILKGLCKKYAPEIWGVRPAGDLNSESAAAFRKELPEVRIIQELTACQPGELLSDGNTVYCFRVRNMEALLSLKRFLARYPAAVLVTAPAEMARDIERENWSFALEVTDGTLPRSGIIAERELVKNATPEKRMASVVRAVARVRQPDSLVFGFITDTHYQVDPPFSSPPHIYYYTGSLKQMQRMADLAKAVKADFVGHGGDVVDGIRPKQDLQKDLQDVVRVLKSSGAPVLIAKGNHDDGSLWCFRNKNGRVEDILTQSEWFRTVTKAALDAGAVGDPERADAGYYYMDFPTAKTRVIVLNCSENPHTLRPDGRLQFHSIGITDVGARQINWMAKKALNFQDKKDRKEWGVLIINHADLSRDTALNVHNLNGVLAAYLNGGKFSGESYPGVCGVDPGRVSCDFTAQGPMKIHGSLYGHIHRMTKKDHYRHDGRLLELNFSTALAPQQDLDTANAGGFAMLVLNPTENKLYVFRFGRGCDEVYPLTLTAK
ncbi:MAG: metallophosphoesterase [Lentisphaeria bacterium]|nr:metallophosphoesterase [Lentisphaeria bacterium]